MARADFGAREHYVDSLAAAFVSALNGCR